MSKYGDFSGPYFSAFGLNTERFSPNAGKYGPENTRYLDTFHTVMATRNCWSKYWFEINKRILDLAFIIFYLNRNEWRLVVDIYYKCFFLKNCQAHLNGITCPTCCIIHHDVMIDKTFSLIP